MDKRSLWTILEMITTEKKHLCLVERMIASVDGIANNKSELFFCNQMELVLFFSNDANQETSKNYRFLWMVLLFLLVKSVSEWTSERMHWWVRKWTIKWMDQWASKSVPVKWVNESVNFSKCVSQQVSEFMNEWVNSWANEWTNE